MASNGNGLVPINELPKRLSDRQAVATAYAEDLDWVEEKLGQRVSVLVECDKQLYLHLFLAWRQRARDQGNQDLYEVVGGPPTPESGGSVINNTIMQLAEKVFAGDPSKILVVPHLDIAVTTTKSGLSDKAREVIAMVYENPNIVVLAFKDPSLELPKAISALFPAKRKVLGIERGRVQHLITQREARKFGVEEFNPFSLYKYVSGLNVVRFRQVMGTLGNRTDFDPADPDQLALLFRDIREMTLLDELAVPAIDLEKDVGGYGKVKKKMQEEILELLQYKDSLTDPEEVKEIEEIVPKGMLFVGPPGTGKTFFAKAMATALDASVQVVSGPELKSKWVGESEQNLREVFEKARKSAPAIIIFDEIDSFASARGTYTGSGVEHSMVNQLLTEMDGFRKDELIFVVGTTNFPESLDPALLRPGRFEFHIKIDYPDDKDRKAILDIYRRKFGLRMSDDLVRFLVEKTAGLYNRESGARYAGDHLNAVCRALKREVIRRSWRTGGDTTVTEDDCMKALKRDSRGKIQKLEFKEKEERVLAVHEAGHAVVSHFCKHSDPLKRVSISTSDTMTLGAVLHEAREDEYLTTRGRLTDHICLYLGGRVAEEICLGDYSTGSQSDLQNATMIARAMVEELGMSDVGIRVAVGPVGEVIRAGARPGVSQDLAKRMDKAIEEIIQREMARAKEILEENRDLHNDLVEALLDKKTLYKKDLVEILGEKDED
jgi:cell division protease FtsH